MKKISFLILVLLITESICVGEPISVPWEEFKTLYTESITRQMMGEAKKEKDPMIYSIETAFYKITIDKQKAPGDMTLAGKVISGQPEVIPLFGSKVVIKDLKMVSGGSLLCNEKHNNEMLFLPDENTNFQISFPQANGT